MNLKNKITQIMFIAICLFAATALTLQAEEENKAAPLYPGWGTMSPTMQKSMSPEVMKKMMDWMVAPQKMMTMESCASCHEGENLARIAKDWGPMLSSMKPMVDMMNPMTGMVEPMMNPMISMMHPMADMMAPMMNMMGPMMNPMMAMMNPMMGMMYPMMNPMMGMMGPMMNPAFYMNMMGPMMGMMGPMMGMGTMGMMNPMMGYPGSNQMNQMMDPKQYENWFNQWTESMKNMTPQASQ